MSVRRAAMPIARRRAAAVASACVAAGIIGACASQGLPPGGPPDTAPPKLMKVSPESGTTNAKPSSVQFDFDEVVSERPRGASGLEQLVVISPSDGTPAVDWGRTRLTIRPRKGWRPNTAYVVTVLPGLTDLRGNSAKQGFRTVFSTGATIPTGVVRGVVFDWIKGAAAPGARIEAWIGDDTILRWSTAADSSGRFMLGSMPDATFLVRGCIDQNNNTVCDRREAWDTVRVAVHDSLRADFYAFPHDTLGARLADVTVTDSVTVRLRFDHGLRPTQALDGAQFAVMRQRDSTQLRLSGVFAAGAYDSLATKRKAAYDDSVAHSDTSEKGRKALATADSARRARVSDSTAKAQIDSVKALRDTTRRVPPPRPNRPLPPTEFVMVLAEPIPLDVYVIVQAKDVQALEGPRRTSSRIVQRPKPAPRDSTGTKRPPTRPPR